MRISHPTTSVLQQSTYCFDILRVSGHCRDDGGPLRSPSLCCARYEIEPRTPLLGRRVLPIGHRTRTEQQVGQRCFRNHCYILALGTSFIRHTMTSPARASSRRLHVACIMDGNGRWAKRRGLPRTAGHTAGEEALAGVVRAAAQRNVGWLTVFGFSTENWVRPPSEIRHILGLHRKLFGRVDELNAYNVRVNWIGRPFDEPNARTPKSVQRAIVQAIDDTKHNTGMVLTVAFDYGSRAEIVRAVTRAHHTSISAINAELYDPTLPPVDLLVRTSGESRVSNFLLWQAANARVYFTDCSWPDFGAAQLDDALALVST